jgi:hypothetical protein
MKGIGMKLLNRKQQAVIPVGDVSIPLELLKQRSEQLERLIELQKTRSIVEPLESTIERKLEQAKKRAGLSIGVDVSAVQRWCDEIAEEANRVRKEIKECEKTVTSLDSRLAIDESFISSLTAEIARLTAEKVNAQNSFSRELMQRLAESMRNAELGNGLNKEEATLKAVAASNNGFDDSRSELIEIDRKIVFVQAALEEIQSIRCARQLNEQHRQELPQIAELVHRRNELLGELGAVDSQIKKYHLARERWPNEPFANIKERGVYVFENLKKAMNQ